MASARCFDTACASPSTRTRQTRDQEPTARSYPAGGSDDYRASYIEIERLLAITRDSVSRDIRARLRPEIEAVLQAIAAALQQYAREAATGLKVVDDHAHQQCFTKISASLDAL